MTKFFCIETPSREQIMLNLDNLLYAVDYKDIDAYGDRTIMKLIFVGGIEIIVEGRPYELYNRLEEPNNSQQQK